MTAKVKTKLHHTVAKVHKAAPKARLTGEAIAAFFVALETHFMIFSIILMLWLLLDLFELVTCTGKGPRCLDE